MEISKGKIWLFISFIPHYSEVIGDPDFDVEENYRIASLYKINLQVKQKRNINRRCRKPFRKKFGVKFDREEYRKRKLGERCFGNIELRGNRNY